MSGGSLSDVGDHARYLSPRPRGRVAKSIPESSRYEEPVVRLVMQQHREAGVFQWRRRQGPVHLCADLSRWSETDKALFLSACLKDQARVFYIWIEAPTKDLSKCSVNDLVVCTNKNATSPSSRQESADLERSSHPLEMT